SRTNSNYCGLRCASRGEIRLGVLWQPHDRELRTKRNTTVRSSGCGRQWRPEGIGVSPGRPPRLTPVEILYLRHFSSTDLRPLLDEEVEVWGSLLSWDYRGSSDMILRYVDAKILPGYAAVERGSIVGYSFFVYEGSKGVVGDLFVSPRRADVRAIELQMVEHVIATLQQ